MITKLHITRPHFESNDPRIRLPKDIWDWDVFQGPIRIRVTGGDPTGQRSVRTAFEGDYPERTIVTVDRLIKEHQADFDEVARAIPPEAWRYLYFVGTYTLETLASSRFHPQAELRDRCSVSDFEAPPPEFIGSDRPAQDVAGQLDVIIRLMTDAQVSAVWAVLSVAHALHLSIDEVLACEWWHPYWIRSLAEHLERPTVRAVA